MAKKPIRFDSRHIDREKAVRMKKAEERLAHLLEYETENDFLRAYKEWKPDATPEELKEIIRLFRVYAREKRGLAPER